MTLDIQTNSDDDDDEDDDETYISLQHKSLEDACTCCNGFSGNTPSIDCCKYTIIILCVFTNTISLQSVFLISESL